MPYFDTNNKGMHCSVEQRNNGNLEHTHLVVGTEGETLVEGSRKPLVVTLLSLLLSTMQDCLTWMTRLREGICPGHGRIMVTPLVCSVF